MTSFMHVFNTNKVPRVVLVFFTCRYAFGIKRESPRHTRKVRPNQQVRPALLVRPDQQVQLALLVRSALHPATIRVPAITTLTNILCMGRIRCGYVGLIQGV
jgi:hypothetical protein